MLEDKGEAEAEAGAVVSPMVPVPEALAAALREAARIAVERQEKENSPPFEVLDVKGGAAIGRTLAADAAMPAPGYPPYRASVMDGYAVRTADGSSSSSAYRIVGRVYAGDRPTVAAVAPLPGGREDSHLLPPAHYVTTGARVPDDCDCVIPVEDVDVVKEVDGRTEPEIQVLRLNESAVLRPNKWIRAVGCDIPEGTTVLPAGSTLDASSTGLLLQASCRRIDVLPRVKVGLLSTGNELLPDDEVDGNWLAAGATTGLVPDVNRPVLRGLLESWRTCQAVDFGQVRDDDDEALVGTLRSACEKCDVVVTTGGISRGVTDRLELALQKLDAAIHFGRLHMKPGKPTTCATVRCGGTHRREALVFCLPGNPVSAFVCAHLLVRPCLELLYRSPLWIQQQAPASATDRASLHRQRRLLESAPVLHAEVEVVLEDDVVLDVERPEYHRVRLAPPDGTSSSLFRHFRAHSTGVQQSSRLASVRDASALVLLPQGTPSRTKALRGETFVGLLLHENPLYLLLRWFESRHVRNTPLMADHHYPPPAAPPTTTRGNRSFDVGVIVLQAMPPTVAPADAEVPFEPPADPSEVSQQVQRALTGSRSGTVAVVWCRTYAYPADRDPRQVWQEVVANGGDPSEDLPPHSSRCDVLALAYTGPWSAQLRFAAYLRSRMGKVADAIALQARKGAASARPTTALAEVVVGLETTADDHRHPSQQKDSTRTRRLVLLLPLEGLVAALENVRGLVKHALEVAREVPTPAH